MSFNIIVIFYFNYVIFIIRISTSGASMPVRLRQLWTTLQITVSDSLRAASTDWSAILDSSLRHCVMPGGQAVRCPVPDLSRILFRNMMLSSVKHLWRCIQVISWSWVNCQLSGGSNVTKSTRYTGWWCLARYHTRHNPKSVERQDISSSAGGRPCRTFKVISMGMLGPMVMTSNVICAVR